MTARDILANYDFTLYFYRRYAITIAKKLIDLANEPDSRSLKAIEVAEAYLEGKATDKELGEAQVAAYSAYGTANSDIMYHSYYNVTYMAFCAVSNNAAYNHAIYACYYAEDIDTKAMLLKQIHELSELEKAMAGLPEDL